MDSTSQYPAALLIIGSEITTGRVADKHGSYLAGELDQIGYTIQEIVAIPDSADTIGSALSRLTALNTLVVCTGGLGPTSDDMTLEVLDAIQQPITNSDAINQRHILKNRVGIAPGVITQIAECLLVLLPGPVRELQPMVRHQLIPYLLQHQKLQRTPRLILSSFAAPESRIDGFLQHSQQGTHDQLQWGTRIGDWKTEIVLYNAPLHRLQRHLHALRKEFGFWHIQEGDRDVAYHAVAMLVAAGQQLVCVESCTAGLLSSRIGAISGASQVLWGGTSLYSQHAKQWFGIPAADVERYGTVSAEITQAMAHQALLRTKGEAQVALAISCVAGPDRDERQQNVGTTWIALESHNRCYTQSYCLSGSRESIRRKAVVQALLALLYFLDPEHQNIKKDGQ